MSFYDGSFFPGHGISVGSNPYVSDVLFRDLLRAGSGAAAGLWLDFGFEPFICGDRQFPECCIWESFRDLFPVLFSRVCACDSAVRGIFVLPETG